MRLPALAQLSVASSRSSVNAVSQLRCCSEDLFPQIEDVYPRPGESPVTIKVRHTGEGTMELSPWPFAAERLEFELPCKRVPAKAYGSEQEFRDVYSAAPGEIYRVAISAF